MLRTLTKACVRHYSLPEYHSKQLLAEYSVKVQRGIMAESAETAYTLSSILRPPYILKANVPVGGRGLGVLTGGLKGGVHICDSTQSVRHLASQMIGHNLITKQTTKEGIRVDTVLVNEGINIDKEVYLAIVLDPIHKGPVLIYTEKGGVDIQKTAHDSPHSIHYYPIPKAGITLDKALQITEQLRFYDQTRMQAARDILKLYKLFKEKDCLQLEINPWAISDQKEAYCVDAKINIDDNALFRQESIAKTQVVEQTDEGEAQKNGLNYIGMDGDIACMVNGAGLAMATMDIIQMKGGSPANFLDIGGGANSQQVSTALDILLRQKAVKAVFVNIFGGIVRCDLIASRLVEKLKTITQIVPIVVRFRGNRMEEASATLDAGRFSFVYPENDMDKAAELVVNLAKRP